MARALDVEEFLSLPGVAFDVRSPGEFHHAPIQGALSLPLFNDDERAQVGTCYKQRGREAAVELGLRLAAPRFADMVCDARERCGGLTAKVYCWRGGMRSNSVAWLLETAGIAAVTLRGGYKSYRRQCLKLLDQIATTEQPNIFVIAGMTGAGKTEILHALKARGEQVLDLEDLAHHRGSTYGMVGMPPQPSNEHFENQIAMAWRHLDLARRIWIEDESQQVGRLRIPNSLFAAMQQATTLQVDKPVAERVAHLLAVYGSAEPAELIAATQRLKKGLGGQRTHDIVASIEAGRLDDAVMLTLEYYDKAYHHSLLRKSQRPEVVKADRLTPAEWAEALLNAAQTL